MNFSMSNIGCGAGEVNGLYGFKGGDGLPNAKHITSSLFSAMRLTSGIINYNLILFGDGVRQGNGVALATWLEENKLGKVVSSEVVANPSHKEKGYMGYQAFMWYVDLAATKAWYDAELKTANEITQKALDASKDKAEFKAKDAAAAAQTIYFNGNAYANYAPGYPNGFAKRGPDGRFKA